MATLQLDQIRVGMILQSDVRDRSGRMLLGAGSTITERHLQIFKIWGVTEAEIRGECDSGRTEEYRHSDANRLSEAETKVKELFCRANLEHPAMEKLFEMAVKEFANRG